MAYDDEEYGTGGYSEAPYEDVEDSSQGYDPGPVAIPDEGLDPPREAAPEPVDVEDSGPAPARGEDVAIPDEYVPIEQEQAPQPEQTAEDDRGWVQRLFDDAKSLFGLNEAVPTPDDEATEQPGTRTPEPPKAAEQQPLTKDSSLWDVASGAAGKFLSDTGTALRQAVAPSEQEKKDLWQPQEGPVKKMLREYVMGEGRLPDDERRQREAQVAANAPQDKPVTKSDIREAALKQAYEQDPKKGVEMLQNYRSNQTALRGLAAAAMEAKDGNAESHRDNATKLWNEAHSFVPDGGHAVASPTANGVMMSVRDAKTGQTTATMLSDDQFRSLLKGTPGEFEHLSTRGLQGMLADVVRTPGTPAGQGAGGATSGGAAPGGVTAAPANAPAGIAGPGGVPPPGPGQLDDSQPGGRVPATGRVGDQGRPPTPGPPPGQGGRPNDAAGYRVMPDGSRQQLPPGADITRMRPPPGGFLTKGPGYATLANGPQQGPSAGGGAAPPKNAVEAATRAGVDPKYGRDVRDPDGWPAGVPRGGSFANTPGTATRDFSTPMRTTGSGKIVPAGRDGSKPVYDVGGRTYDVDPKTGLPKPQQGQPGWQGPQRGDRNWNGTPGKYTDRSPFLGDRSQLPSTNAGGRTPSAPAGQLTPAQAARIELEREKLGLRRELGTSGQDLRRQDLERKTQQGGSRLGQSDRRLDQGDRRLDQGDQRRQDQQQRYSQQDAAKAADRVQKMEANQVTNATHALNARIKEVGYDGLSKEEQALHGALRQRATEALSRRETAPTSGAPAAGGGGSAPAPRTAINPDTGERLILQNGKWVPYKG